MSGVALTSVASSRGVTLTPRDPLPGLLPGPLVATREFDSGDTLALFTESMKTAAPRNTRSESRPTVSRDILVRVR